MITETAMETAIEMVENGIINDYDDSEQKFIDDNQLKIGDKVKLLKKATYHERGWCNTWPQEMSDNIGKVGIIKDFGIRASGIEVAFPDESFAYFSYPYFVLEKV